MTTAQGLTTTTLGARLWSEGHGGIRTTGIVLTGMGILNTAIGLVHFPGKPRSARVLERTEKQLGSRSHYRLQMTTLHAGSGQWVPAVSAGGTF